MAVLNGPGIITSGLISALDAADRNSYPGSGTTWTDISGNNNNGTLTNGPTFSSTNGGAIVLDGADDYINTGTINLQRNFSLEVIVNMDVTSGFCFFGQGTTTTNQGLHIWMISSGTVLVLGIQAIS